MVIVHFVSVITLMDAVPDFHDLSTILLYLIGVHIIHFVEALGQILLGNLFMTSMATSTP